MDQTHKILSTITVIAIIIFVVYSTITEIFYQALPYITIIPLTTGFIKILQDKSKTNKIKKHVLEFVIEPAITPLVTFLQNQSNISIEKMDYFVKESEKSINNEADISSSIIYISYLFSKIQNIDENYIKSYSLAIAYKLSVLMDIKRGETAKDIDGAVTRRKIKCGDQKWDISDQILEWYKRFLDSDRILHIPYQEIFDEVKDKEIEQVNVKRDEIKEKIVELTKFASDKEIKLEKLLHLVTKKIPKINFFNILSSLKTDIVIISSQGKGDSNTDDHLTGAKYLNQALDELEINYGKLNNSVRFCFLHDIMKGIESRYFNPQNWGNQIAHRANELRSSEQDGEKKFNFAILRSSLHDLQFFGDKIEKGRIVIPEDIIKGVQHQEVTFSTLMIIAKALQNEQISLTDFINKNLEYLDGIPDEETANNLIDVLNEKIEKKIGKFQICQI